MVMYGAADEKENIIVQSFDMCSAYAVW